VTFWVLLLFVTCDLGNTATEFAGVASVAPIFGGFLGITNAALCKTVLVPLAALLVFQVVTRANRDIVERIFFVLCAVYLSYVISAIIVHPDWHDVLHQIFFPQFSSSKAYVLMIIAVIGTTISPWMQFYIQAAIVEKGVREHQYAASRIDVISGALVTDIIAFFIVIACAATIYIHNMHATSAHQIQVNDVGDVAVALQPLAGRFASLLFAVGLLNAAIFTASILPVVLVLMLLLINNKRIMGRWTNNLIFNVIAWTTVVSVSALTLVSTVQIIFPQIGS
jgi:Mn2+/Fe2+ NRAMP family transporter